MSDIPMRRLGRANVTVSALAMGGHHLGDVEDEKTALRLVQEAVDGGITLFDNCWEYHRGKSEEWPGKGLKGRRDRVFLMTKVCTHVAARERVACAPVCYRSYAAALWDRARAAT